MCGVALMTGLPAPLSTETCTAGAITWPAVVVLGWTVNAKCDSLGPGPGRGPGGSSAPHASRRASTALNKRPLRIEPTLRLVSELALIPNVRTTSEWSSRLPIQNPCHDPRCLARPVDTCGGVITRRLASQGWHATGNSTWLLG